MKILRFVVVSSILVLGIVLLASAYGEGPSGSGNWVYGKVTYSDGSKCGKCCGIGVETENGFSKDGCTNSSGEYKVYVASSYAKKVYYKGKVVWSGSKATKGGARIDIHI